MKALHLALLLVALTLFEAEGGMAGFQCGILSGWLV
jgi:hypothetical protein